MKRILVLSAALMLFIACDFAKESVELYPDIEITYVDPLGWVTSETDPDTLAMIDEIHFIPRNSVDSHIKKMIWAYYDANDNLFYGPYEMAIFLRIPGIVHSECEIDTAKILNIPLPLDTVRNYCLSQHIYDAKAILQFIAEDDYMWEREDTSEVWFGFGVMP